VFNELQLKEALSGDAQFGGHDGAHQGDFVSSGIVRIALDDREVRMSGIHHPTLIKDDKGEAH